MSEPLVVATLAKNSREKIRVALVEFKDILLCDLRVFVPLDGQDVATKKGISFKPLLLPELIAALQKAEAEARRRGLLNSEEGLAA